MAISISYYGSKKPAPNVKPQRTINYPDGTPPEKLPFGKKNPIDWMTGKHLVQLKPEPAEPAEPAESAESDGRVKVTSADDLGYLGEKVDDSIVVDGLKVRLDGDAAAPGSNKLYGTDDEGAKGWRDAPTELPTGTNGQVMKHNGTSWAAVTPVTLNVVTGVTYNTSTHVLAFTYRQVTIIAYGAESSTTIETAVAES